MLVCGLGSLGQACLQRLLAFDVPLSGLDLQPPAWQIPDLGDRLQDRLTLGDMRLAPVLLRAGAAEARSVLLLSSDSNANVEAALQVRLLNAEAEIVVRSSSQQADLGTLLEERLPGIAVVDPLLLTASAIVTALRPGRPVASFEAEGQCFEIVEAPIDDRRYQRLLRFPGGSDGHGPTPLTLTSFRSRQMVAAAPDRLLPRLRRWLSRGLRRWLQWCRRRSTAQWAAAALLGTLLVVGIPLFSAVGGWKQGMFVTLALLKGEYVDPVNVVVSGTGGPRAMSGWLIAGSLLYSLIGTLLTSALVAFILERLLRDRLGQVRWRKLRRGSRPVLLVEGGALARRVGHSLLRDRQVLLRVDGSDRSASPEPGCLVVDQLERALEALDGHEVSAVGLLSADLITNLSGALSCQRRWPGARIAILAHAVAASQRLGDLLGGVSVISTVDLVADAVVATAFGERVEGVLPVRGENLLLVRYRIRADDTLCGRSVSRLENGYGLTVVSLWRRRQSRPRELPAPELVLDEGDQLLVLAALSSLRRIERGEVLPPLWRLRLRLPASASSVSCFEAQQSLARWIGCPPAEVAHLLDGEDHLTPPLDREIGEQLREELRRRGVHCALEAAEGPRTPLGCGREEEALDET